MDKWLKSRVSVEGNANAQRVPLSRREREVASGFTSGTPLFVTQEVVDEGAPSGLAAYQPSPLTRKMQSLIMSHARDLRQNSGLAGQRVWARLRGGAVDGIKVRRQHRIGRYIVDFACVALRLAIEIDGGVHDHDDVILRDHHRQTGIEALGWTVIRFSNDVALGEPWRIDDAIRERARLLGLL